MSHHEARIRGKLKEVGGEAFRKVFGRAPEGLIHRHAACAALGARTCLQAHRHPKGKPFWRPTRVEVFHTHKVTWTFAGCPPVYLLHDPWSTGQGWTAVVDWMPMGFRPLYRQDYLGQNWKWPSLVVTRTEPACGRFDEQPKLR